jgi:hypothetical protein
MEKQKPTYLEQLFASKRNKWLWALVATLLIIGLAGRIFDLSEPFIGNQGLDAGSATGALVIGLIMAGFILGVTWFQSEYKADRKNGYNS